LKSRKKAGDAKGRNKGKVRRKGEKNWTKDRANIKGRHDDQTDRLKPKQVEPLPTCAEKRKNKGQTAGIDQTGEKGKARNKAKKEG